MTLNSEAVKIQIARWEDELRQMVHDEDVHLVPMRDPGKTLSLEELTEVITHVTGISIGEMRSKDRKREIVAARHLLCYFAYDPRKTTWASIGKFLGDRDHTTAMHGYKTHRDLLETAHSATIEQTAKVRLYIEAVQKRLKEKN